VIDNITSPKWHKFALHLQVPSEYQTCLDSFQWQTVDQYAPLWKLLSVTSTFELMTLKVSCGADK